jgi:hypothetical protein
VNLTSRVEAATKVFGVPCLLTGAIRQALTAPVTLRRLCRARLTGMTEPVELFELAAVSGQSRWTALRDRYETALSLFEQNRIAECQAACRALQADFGSSDGPTNWLLKQTDVRLTGTDKPFEPVFDVETK